MRAAAAFCTLFLVMLVSRPAPPVTAQSTTVYVHGSTQRAGKLASGIVVTVTLPDGTSKAAASEFGYWGAYVRVMPGQYRVTCAGGCVRGVPAGAGILDCAGVFGLDGSLSTYGDFAIVMQAPTPTPTITATGTPTSTPEPTATPTPVPTPTAATPCRCVCDEVLGWFSAMVDGHAVGELQCAPGHLTCYGERCAPETSSP